MRILVLGATGMLGHEVFRTLGDNASWEIWGTVRDKKNLAFFPLEKRKHLLTDVDGLHEEKLKEVFEGIQPDVVINCIGIIKQLAASKDPWVVLPVNAMLPHRLARLCIRYRSRLIHISTDCVFSGKKGLYTEKDPSDADDLYGKSKYIGELADYPHAVTLRTSIIGHELNSCYGLMDWFLSQQHAVKGFTRAVFSGFPTVELCHILREYVIMQPDLCGLYHVAASPVSKFDLLTLAAEIYGKSVDIHPEDACVIDRSLDASQFNARTGYRPPAWPGLVSRMHQSFLNLKGAAHVS